MIRLFLDQPMGPGARLTPDADQARYLTGVMRKGPGDEILVFNGRDGEWRAAIAEVSKKGCVLEARERTRDQTGVPDLELWVALIKRARLETVIEKATELGCARVRLVTTRRTQADHANVARLRAIAIEAAEQTERLEVPEIVGPEKLDRLLDARDGSRALLFCDESDVEGWGDEGGARVPVRPAAQALAAAARGPWAVLIGPEGGFAPEERERLRAAPAVTAVSLGPRILRADTAAISALTLWQAFLGDWSPTERSPKQA